MRLDGAADIAVGETRAARVMLGGIQVWPSETPRLEVSPDTIWLLRSKDWTEYVEIISNVKWSAG